MLLSCSSEAFVFWSYAMLTVLFVMSLAVLVLLGPGFVRGCIHLFRELPPVTPVDGEPVTEVVQ